MRVLFLQPYGILGDWNHRLKRQVELMKEKCDLKIINSARGVTLRDGVSSIWIKEVESAIENFKPDVLYINGFLLAYHCLYLHKKIVFDMGSWEMRNILIRNKLDYPEIRKLSIKALEKKANWAYDATACRKERKVIEKVDAIIIWESEEAKLVKKIYDVEDKLHEISMMFYELPKPIPWEKKKEKVIAIAAKWNSLGKRGRLINDINSKLGKDSKYYIRAIGHEGNSEEFISHKELMDELNDSKVLFCPYACGGIGVINEALKLGCNVVVGDWHPYLTYINDELIIDSSKKMMGRCIDMLGRAMEKYYPPKKKLPTEEEQLDKILKICEQVIKI